MLETRESGKSHSNCCSRLAIIDLVGGVGLPARPPRGSNWGRLAGVCFERPLRRTFLMGLGASSLLAGRTSGISLGCRTNAWPIDPASFDSLLAVLEKIREIGFAGFETGFRNLQSQAKHLDSARQKIKSSGLQFFGVHIFLLQYDERIHIAPAELFESVARAGAALGAQWLILSGAPASTEDELARKAEGLHKAGVSARSFGLKLAYAKRHNCCDRTTITTRNSRTRPGRFSVSCASPIRTSSAACWTQATRSKAEPMCLRSLKKITVASSACTSATFTVAGKSRLAPATSIGPGGRRAEND
jgi:hypothetical protein